MLIVLSLFDGISAGQVALERAGIKVDKYYASEIDKYAIKITQKNYPNTIHLGSVTLLNGNILPKIDLLIGGSPCQGFSIAGKWLNFDDPRSKLFFEYVRLLRECKPKYFLLENVKMKKEWQDIISKELGVEPVEINSSLVSAQNRKRLYWTNIPIEGLPQDKGITLKDIVHENVDVKVSAVGKNNKAHSLTATYNGAVAWNSYERKHRTMVFEQLAEYIVPFDKTLQILDKEVARGKIGYFRKDSQANRVYYIHDKAVTLCGDAGGGAAKMGQYLMGCITPDRIEKRQNGQRFNEGNKFYTLTAQDKHGILIEGYIRKLTPTECERLQTFPDGFTEYGDEEICVKFAKLVNAKDQFLTNQQDIVINTISDLLEQEPQTREKLLIEKQIVSSMVVQEKEKPAITCASCTISDLLEREQLIKTLQKLKNVKFVVKIQLQKNYVEIIIQTTADTETQFIPKGLEILQMYMDTKNQGENIELSIEKSQRQLLEENLPLKMWFIILTLTNKIIFQKISLSVASQNISYCIDNLNISPQNYLNWDISNLKMGNIMKISKSQRYKCLGNSWTVDVISWIFSFIR